MEYSIETSTAARTKQVALQQTDSFLQNLGTKLMVWLKASWGLGLAGMVAKDACRVSLEKLQPFLGNSEDPAMLEAFLYSCELYLSLAGIVSSQ